MLLYVPVTWYHSFVKLTLVVASVVVVAAMLLLSVLGVVPVGVFLRVGRCCVPWCCFGKLLSLRLLTSV